MALKGIDYEYRAVSLIKGEQNAADYKSMSATGYVPTLIIDGHCLNDSMAILEYLDETRPDPVRLLPSDPADRAKVRSLAYIISSGIQPLQNLSVLQYAESCNVDKAAWPKHFIEKGFSALEQALGSTAGKYCFGDQITLADVCVAPQIYAANRFKVDVSKYPIISRVAAACAEHPSFVAAHAFQQPDCPEDQK